MRLTREQRWALDRAIVVLAGTAKHRAELGDKLAPGMLRPEELDLVVEILIKLQDPLYARVGALTTLQQAEPPLPPEPVA